MYKYLIISCLLLLSFCHQPTEPNEPLKLPKDTVPELVSTDRSLREIIAEDYPDGNVYIGTSCKYLVWNTRTEEIISNQFSYITPTNDFKQPYIVGVPGAWRWDRPDTWVEKSQQNNQVMRIHGPISPQCSKWVKNDARTPDELESMLRDYMTELCKRYNKYGHIIWMDVVNETVTSEGDWFGPKPGDNLWENPWTQIGFDTDALRTPLYIKYAFEIANQYAPNIKLVINQHGTVDDIIWDKIKYLVGYLRDKGLRVDGIGWQAHIDMGWDKIEGNLDKLDKLVKWAHANNLDFLVTENNVWLKAGNENKWDEQAETFAAIVKVLIANRNTGIVGWNLWELKDEDNGHPEWYGSLYFNNYEPKPAYYAIKKVLENPPVE